MNKKLTDGFQKFRTKLLKISISQKYKMMSKARDNFDAYPAPKEEVVVEPHKVEGELCFSLFCCRISKLIIRVFKNQTYAQLDICFCRKLGKALKAIHQP